MSKITLLPLTASDEALVDRLAADIRPRRRTEVALVRTLFAGALAAGFTIECDASHQNRPASVFKDSADADALVELVFGSGIYPAYYWLEAYAAQAVAGGAVEQRWQGSVTLAIDQPGRFLIDEFSSNTEAFRAWVEPIHALDQQIQEQEIAAAPQKALAAKQRQALARASAILAAAGLASVEELADKSAKALASLRELRDEAIHSEEWSDMTPEEHAAMLARADTAIRLFNLAPYEPRPDECALTGIPTHNCPCGHHE